MTHHALIPRPTFETSHVSVTLRLADGADDLLIRHVRLLRDCVALAQARWGFSVEAAVVLPTEVQLLCSFPDAQFGVRGAIRLITAAFARHVPGDLSGRSDDIWAESTEITEVGTGGVAMRRRFIEQAPVRAGLARRAEDWPHSSANKSIAQASDIGVAVA